MKQKAKLENWITFQDYLIGTVYGHPQIADGTHVRTSRLVTFDKETKQAVTQNTEYVLGEPMDLDKGIQ